MCLLGRRLRVFWGSPSRVSLLPVSGAYHPASRSLISPGVTAPLATLRTCFPPIALAVRRSLCETSRLLLPVRQS